MVKKILIIEDDPFMLKLYQEHIKSFEVDFEFATDGKQGLTMVESYQPDLLVLDIQMPNLGGIEMLNELQKMEHAPPVVVVSNIEDPEKIQAAKERGVLDYLLKTNFASEDLLKKIISFLET